MASRQPGATVNYLGQLFNHGTASGLSERELLDRFLAARDEIAFEAILARHGPMVLGVCRRILRDRHEIDDAFQATFLVFARRAGSIRGAESVGRWLHGVARRVARRADAQRTLLSVRGGDLSAEEPASPDGSPDEIAVGKELLAVLDDELTRLPASLRSPIILCDLEGLTREEAANRLGWPVGTVHSRLSRARDQLRRRLFRRGLTANDAAFSAAIAYRPVPLSLFKATVGLSVKFASRRAALSAACPVPSTLLAQGVLHTMMISNLKILGTTALACSLALGVLGKSVVQSGAEAGGLNQAAVDRQEREEEKQEPGDMQEEVARLRRQNTQLQKEVDDLRRQLESMRRPDPAKLPKPAAASDPQRPPGEPGVPIPGLSLHRGGSNSTKKNRLNYVSTGQIIVVVSPDGNTVTAYSTETGKAKSLQLLRHDGAKYKVVPIVSPGLALLHMKGQSIAQLAAFNLIDGNWHTQTLNELVDEAKPLVGPGLAVYPIGRRLYAFSATAKRWDVLELPEGAVPIPALGPAAITCEYEGRLHVFSAKTGTWEAISIEAPPVIERSLDPRSR